MTQEFGLEEHEGAIGLGPPGNRATWFNTIPAATMDALEKLKYLRSRPS